MDLIKRSDVLYADRDHEKQGEYYLRHIYAMTREGLHAKSAIAGELAHRDIRIAELEAQLARFEIVGEVKPSRMVEWNQAFSTSCKTGTKLFALKD